MEDAPARRALPNDGERATKIELVQVSAMIVMLFEDLFHGMMRNIYLKRGNPAKLEET